MINVDDFSQSGIIILRGVFKNYLCKNIVRTAAPAADAATASITPLPRKFTTVDSWPRESSLQCWWCDLVGSDYPKFVPLGARIEYISADFLDPTDESGRVIATETAEPHGNFCTWNCVVAYILEKYPQEQSWDLIESVKRIECLFSDHKKFQILPSPPRTERREFCGSGGLTIAEYKDAINKLRDATAPTDYLTLRTWPPRQYQPKVI